MVRTPLPSEILSPYIFDHISALNWIRECRKSHESCQKLGQFKEHSQAPTRLLDVSQSNEDFIKLVLLPNNNPVEYAALSYCWGGCNNFVSTASTLETNEKGIHISRIPKTIQDAIRITQMMKIRYIWIDAICIIQDSAEDKIKELARMGVYYRNALFVIAASSASHANEGFLGHLQVGTPFYTTAVKQKERQNQTVFAPFYGPSDIEGRMAIDLVSEPYTPNTEPLEKRAWTYQEGLLCPRVLHFPSTGGFYLQCNKERRHNDTIYFGMAPERMLILSNEFRSQFETLDQSRLLHEAWLMHTRRFSNRLLTNKDDKFNAIAGVAEAYKHHGNITLGDYLAGHWSKFIIESLNWRVYGSHLQTDGKPKRSPSWSWLSVDSPITPVSGLIFEKHFRSLVDIQFSGVKLVHEKLPLGPVQVGCIAMRARIGKATWISDPRRRYHCSLRLGDEDSSIRALAATDTVEMFPMAPVEVYFMPLCVAGVHSYVFGLILQRVAPYEHLFYRTGHFENAPREFLESCSQPMLASII